MGRSRFGWQTRVGLVAAFGLFTATQQASAHNAKCPHNHDETFPNSISYCANDDEVCDDPKTCQQQQSRNQGWCACTEPKAGATFSGHMRLVPNVPGPPLAFTTKGYHAVVDPGNVWDVLHTVGGAQLLTLGPGGLAAPVTLTLAFGSFADPAHIPVTLTAITLSLPTMTIDGQVTGPNAIHMPVGQTQALVYDAGTGLVDTVGSGGIPIVTDNALGSWTDSRLFLQLLIEPGGALISTTQGTTFLPLAIPAVSHFGIALVGAMLLLAAGIALRMRNQESGA